MTQGRFSTRKNISYGDVNSEKTGLNPPAATAGGYPSIFGGMKPSSGTEGGKIFTFGGSKLGGKPALQVPSAVGRSFGSISSGKKIEGKETSSLEDDNHTQASSNQQDKMSFNGVREIQQDHLGGSGCSFGGRNRRKISILTNTSVLKTRYSGKKLMYAFNVLVFFFSFFSVVAFSSSPFFSFHNNDRDAS